MYRTFTTRFQGGALLASFLVLASCGGGSSSTQAFSRPEPQQQLFIEGAGIKGPLAFATVELYRFDARLEQLYDSKNPIATTVTNAYAEISGLQVPIDIPPPYVLVIEGKNAIDLNTGVAPVIETLITIITRESLESGRPVYATPYTTLAYNLLFRSKLETADVPLDTILDESNRMIIRSIGFGMPMEVDLFNTPPIITGNTTTIEEQQIVVQYRAAIEALSSLVHEMSLSSPNTSSDILLNHIALDLYSDGVINDSPDGREKYGFIDMDILRQDPMNLTIANTEYLVEDTLALMSEERTVIGSNSNTPFLTDNLTINLQPASLDSTIELPSVNTLSTDRGYIVDDVTVSFAQPTPAEDPANISYPVPMGNLASTLLASGLVASGPIVINGESDIVISGKHITNPNGDCIVVANNASNITIKDSIIGPCGKKGISIHTGSHHVTVTGNYIHDIELDAVWSYEAYNVTVDSNMMERVQRGFGMWTTPKGNLRFTNNFVKNIVGTPGLPGAAGNMAMAAYVRGPGIRINNNIAVNVLGESWTEDLINLYKSKGQPDDPIQVNNNKLLGGGPSLSGGGIILGDSGGSYQEARNNILVNPGQYGIAISAGNNMVLAGNKVFSDNKRSFTNGGLIIAWQAKQFNLECNNLEASNNEITFWQGSDFLSPNADPYLLPYGEWGNCGTIKGWKTNKFDTPKNQPANLDETIMPAEILNLY